MIFKDIKEGIDARVGILSGINKAARYVAPSLGPVGGTAIIECPGLDPIEADDGVTILKHLEFENKYEQLGLQKIRKAALRTSVEGGDGTASTATLTGALAQAAYKAISGDSMRSDEVKSRLKAGLSETLSLLSTMRREVTQSDVVRIATVSSLDPEVATIISDIIEVIGPTGIITVEKGSRLGYSKEIVKGARFDKGLISEYFMDDREKGTCTLENPWIALVDRKISIGVQVKSIMEAIAKTDSKSILFVADDVDGIALASLIQASKNMAFVQADGKSVTTGLYDIACVRNPYTASPSKDFLKDLSALTGATVISEEAGMKLSEAGISLLGRAEKVVVTKNETTIIGCKETPALAERITKIERDIEASTSEYSIGMFKERLARLKGGIGVIRVGAYTDTEFASKKLKFDNAIRAAQGALQEGMLPGGGVALWNVANKITEPIWKEALKAPLKQMAKNAGMNDFFMENIDGIGFDFKTKQRVDMFEAGIIDSYKVTRLVLESATAIAMDVVSYEVAITESKEDNGK